MQRPCFLITIQKVKLIDRRQFPVVIVYQIYKLVVREFFAI